MFYSLGPEFAALAAFVPSEQGSSSYVREDPVEKTVKELLDLDPSENEVHLLCFLVLALFSCSSQSNSFYYVFFFGQCSTNSLSAL